MYTQVAALIFATSLVQLGNGFFTTFIALRLGIEEFSAALEGVILSAFFVGFAIGSVSCGSVIRRIGHIRGYAAFGGIAIGGTVGMALFVHPYAWVILRAAIGFGCVGLFVTTESWLNAKASPALRGRVFSIYMIGTFLALAFGQLLVGRLPLNGGDSFNIIVLLFVAALVIVSMTRAEPPILDRETPISYGEILRAAPIGVLGAATAGLISATFYAVIPSWMLANNVPQETIGVVMLSAVLGGLAFQIPVGRVSDRMDRRLLLGGLALCLALAAVTLVFLPRKLNLVLPVTAAFGGFMSTLYPVCVSHTMDHMAGKRVVSISEKLIFVSGIGSIVGPLTGAWIKSYLDLNGVLYFTAGVAILFGIGALIRAFSGPVESSAEAPFSVVAPQAQHVVPE
ncbi:MULTISPECIES: MFS transporter [unclassified Beijerinckia]|uniref:MFS transporter n=1 Tax=unclassified Beijerinckia TaxID=2638183 RepID=UPI000894719E|nr:MULTISPECIES: MFS transporter [unclassified Beijerinckia]MDH7798853.1 MFS family permease [Beijerinckia sp. GAS462]SED88942.1 Predicted arabinose efflux permease, MFS family [Beijerinckia sp. 28-YEA-48]